MKLAIIHRDISDRSRSSHEERGLKYYTLQTHSDGKTCRSSHEERGLKYVVWQFGDMGIYGRSSHEERGLKYLLSPLTNLLEVAPRMRSVD